MKQARTEIMPCSYLSRVPQRPVPRIALERRRPRPLDDGGSRHEQRQHHHRTCWRQGQRFDTGCPSRQRDLPPVPLEGPAPGVEDDAGRLVVKAGAGRPDSGGSDVRRSRRPPGCRCADHAPARMRRLRPGPARSPVACSICASSASSPSRSRPCNRGKRSG